MRFRTLYTQQKYNLFREETEGYSKLIAELSELPTAIDHTSTRGCKSASEVIQNLPPALFTLMKSTEPWTDQYYVLDLEQEMRDAGFADVVTVGSDPRHRTVMACAA